MEIDIEFGRSCHCIMVIKNPSKTNMAMLKPILNVKRSMPLRSSFFGNNANMNAYPGINNNNTMPNITRRGV